jgi:hypothetical protein
MAYFINQDPDQQKKALQGQDASQGSGSVFSPIAPAAPASPAPAGGGRQSTGSGQFFNFQRILDANKGVGAQEAGRLVGQAQGAANDARAATSAASGKVAQDTQAGTPGVDVFRPVAPVAQPPPTSSAWAGRALVTPDQAGQPFTAPIQNLQNVIAGNAPGSTYTGPKDVANYFNDAGAKTLQAQQQLRGLGTVQGRQTALGGSLLDAILTGAEGGPALGAAAAQADQLGRGLADAYTKGQGLVQGAQQTTNTLQGEAQARLKELEGLQSQAQNQAQSAQETAARTAEDQAAYRRAMNSSGYGDAIPYDQWATLTDEEKRTIAGGGVGALRTINWNSGTRRR